MVDCSRTCNFLSSYVSRLSKITKRRKALIVLITLISSVFGASAQIVINSKFRPFSYEELMMQAQAESAYNARMRQLFDQYSEEAYRRYNNQDLYGFLTYSNYALEIGWHNSKLHFDRGVVFERLNDFKNAKKEYKKAKKAGYAYASNALETCKKHEKEYKRHQKETNKRRY